MSILHVTQIAKRVREGFESHIPKDDLNSKDSELDIKIQTRCLAAFAVQAATECTNIDAGGAVIDGGEDNGLDAVYYSPAQNRLVLVQSKWIKDGKSEPDSAELGKFCRGVRDLVNSEFDRFNPRLRLRQSSIKNALSNFDCRLLLVLAHTGHATLAVHASRQIRDLLNELNDASEIASFENLSQEKIYTMMAEGAAGGAITLEFGLSSYRMIEQRISEAIKSLGKASGKKYGVLVHGNRLAAAAVFRRHKFTPVLGDQSLRPEDHRTELVHTIDYVVDILTKTVEQKYADNFLAVVFKNPTKCRDLFDACVAGDPQLQIPLSVGPQVHNS